MPKQKLRERISEGRKQKSRYPAKRGKERSQPRTDKARRDVLERIASVECVHQDLVGRVMRVEGSEGIRYVAHSWNNEEHTAFSIEGSFRDLNEAVQHLCNL